MEEYENLTFIRIGDEYINIRYIISIDFPNNDTAIIITGELQKQEESYPLVSRKLEVYGEKAVARLRLACSKWTTLHINQE